jgi:cellulose synthase/poly-beta-1,6-N-acetylglucosamine synthase-like glycosyltransferase
MALGPIAHYHSNSKYFSSLPPLPSPSIDSHLPHITIQMPVYKESLQAVLAPSILSLKNAMQTYARQGGTSSIFVCDDGLRVIGRTERDERLAFYASQNVGWVARPKDDDAEGGFRRRGRFKKASNLNYGLELSLKMEKHLEGLLAEHKSGGNPNGGRFSTSSSSSHNHHVPLPLPRKLNSSTSSESTHCQYGIQYQNREGDDSFGSWSGGGLNPTAAAGPPLPTSPLVYSPTNAKGTGAETPTLYDPMYEIEEKALNLAIEDVFLSSSSSSTSNATDAPSSSTPNPAHRPWAANGRSLRIGELLLLVDSDTLVPADCLRDAAREMAKSPQVAIIQHESGVMSVAGHYFESGISYFTTRVNRCIGICVFFFSSDLENFFFLTSQE